MKKFFDKLNLRPFERRLVVIGGVVVFIVVQALFVWPNFGKVAELDLRRDKALETLKAYADEFAQTNKYAQEVQKMEGAGATVPPEDQANDFQQAIIRQSGLSGVVINSNPKPRAQTNEFFLELRSTITTISTEDALVNFLYNLGEGNSLIRVRDLTMRPDPSRMKLASTITLVASYQKKAVPRTVAAPPAKPGTPPPPSAATNPYTARPLPPKPSTPTKK